MLKAPVEDCVAKNADSAVPERKRAPKKAKKGKGPAGTPKDLIRVFKGP